MSSSDYGSELIDRPSEIEVAFLIDAPGLAIIKEDGDLSYTWSPGVCPEEVFYGQLHLWGLEILEETELVPGGLRAGTLISRMEGYAEDQEGSSHASNVG